MKHTHRTVPPSQAAGPRLHRASLPFARRIELLQGGIGAALSAALGSRRVWVNSRLLAWVLLPDGWQGLLQASPLDDPGLRLDCARDAGARAWARLGGHGPLWAAGGRLLPVPCGAAARDAARELVMAPVRGGLADRIGDYPFWDAAWLGAGGDRAEPTSVAATA